MAGKPRPLADSTPNGLSALDAAVQRVRSADDFPAVAGRIHQLMAALSEEDASVQQLANVIEQDYSLTVKLLRVANSFRFNRSGTPVISARHAIVMMGAEAIRDLATTIIVWEHFRRRSPGLRPLLMMSLLSANHARELATCIGTVGAEEAYLVGMLRNLGEVLVACYLPEEYASVLTEIAERKSAVSIACRRVLHFEYEDLGRALVKDWGMPESVARTMSDIGNDDLHTVVSFAHRLTAAVYRQDPASSTHALNALLQKYASLRLTRDEVAGMLEAGIERTRETFALAGVQVDDLQLKQQVNTATASEDGGPSTSAASIAASSSAMRSATSDGTPRPAHEQKQPVDAAQIELNTIMLGMLREAVALGGFNRAVLALVSSTRRELNGRLGAGNASDDFVGRFRFALGPTGGPLGVAASRGQELHLAASRELMPEERKLLKSHDTGSLLMVPLVLGGRVIGALYVDSPRTGRVVDEVLVALRQLRVSMVKALARQPAAA